MKVTILSLRVFFHYLKVFQPNMYGGTDTVVIIMSVSMETAFYTLNFINPLTAGHENIRAGFKCPQCYARVNTMR
jgi:hypothetical protein